jgi:hypothetical protein
MVVDRLIESSVFFGFQNTVVLYLKKIMRDIFVASTTVEMKVWHWIRLLFAALIYKRCFRRNSFFVIGPLERFGNRPSSATHPSAGRIVYEVD